MVQPQDCRPQLCLVCRRVGGTAGPAQPDCSALCCSEHATCASPPSSGRTQLRVPRVVGMLGSGLLLANVPGGVVAAFPAKWGVQMRAAALATIFLRCGLELEFKVC